MNKRQDILTATRDLIIEEGLQAVSFSKILARANVGAGTIYNYFPNKEALINTLYREVADLRDTEILLGYDSSADLKQRFKTLVGNMAKFVLTHRKELGVLVACGHSPYISEELRLRIMPSMEAAFSVLLEGQETGIFAPMNPYMALIITNGAIVAVAQGHLDGKFPLEELDIENAVESCWKALLR